MIKLTIKFKRGKKFELKPREIDKAAQILVDDLQQTVPYDTGKLQSGIRKKKITNGVEIYIKGKRNTEVAGYLIECTKDHFIRPKGSTTYKASGELYQRKRTKFKRGERKKKVLAFQTSIGGQVYFSRGHWVSGIKAGYWKFRPRQKALQKFARQINLAIKSRTM